MTNKNPRNDSRKVGYWLLGIGATTFLVFVAIAVNTGSTTAVNTAALGSIVAAIIGAAILYENRHERSKQQKPNQHKSRKRRT